MPEMRQLDSPMFTDEAVAGAVDAALSQAHPGATSFEGDANALHALMYEAMKDDIDKLGTSLINKLEAMRRACITNRTNRMADARYRRNRARGKATAQVVRDAAGETIPNQLDGHAKLAINQGWSFEAIQAARRALYEVIFQSADRFYTFKGIGKKLENKQLEKILSGNAEYLLRRAGFYHRIPDTICTMAPMDGTTFLRYDMAFQHKMVREADSVFRERPAAEQVDVDVAAPPAGTQPNLTPPTVHEKWRNLLPQFCIWDYPDVTVTQYDSPYADEQEGVFWLTPYCTLRRLEPDEAVMDWIDGADPINAGPGQGVGSLGLGSYQQIMGRFTNLKPLIEKELNTQTAPGDGARISNFPQFTLVEYEGSIPLAQLAKDGDGTFTPALAEYFMVNVGDTPDPMNANAMLEWRRRLNRISHWHVTYIIENEMGGGGNSGLGRHMIELRPCPYREGRNSMFNLPYLREGMEFMGLSISDAGFKLENAGDGMRNNQIIAKNYNADPAVFYKKNFLAKNDPAEMERVFKPGAKIQIQESVRADEIRGKCIDFFELPDAPDTENSIAILKGQFQTVVGVPPTTNASLNAPNTGTATELKLNTQRTMGLIGHIALGISWQLCKMVQRMMRDTIEILGWDEFVELSIAANGLGIEEMDQVKDEILNYEFEVIPSLSSNQDSIVQATSIMRAFQVFGPTGAMDPHESCRRTLECLKVPDIDPIVTGGDPPLSPGTEHMLMGQGTMIRVNPQDNDLAHLQDHEPMLPIAKLAAVNPAVAAEYQFTMPPADIQKLADALPQHIEDHKIAYQQKVMMAQQQAQMMQGGGDQGGKGKPKDPRLGGANQLETDTVPADAQQMSQNINERAGMVPGGNMG